jgi:hypothetical protein
MHSESPKSCSVVCPNCGSAHISKSRRKDRQSTYSVGSCSETRIAAWIAISVFSTFTAPTLRSTTLANQPPNQWGRSRYADGRANQDRIQTCRETTSPDILRRIAKSGTPRWQRQRTSSVGERQPAAEARNTFPTGKERSGSLTSDPERKNVQCANTLVGPSIAGGLHGI